MNNAVHTVLYLDFFNLFKLPFIDMHLRCLEDLFFENENWWLFTGSYSLLLFLVKSVNLLK